MEEPEQPWQQAHHAHQLKASDTVPPAHVPTAGVGNDRISREARATTKALMRQPTIDKFNKRREADVEEVVSLLTAEKTQKNLGAYLASLSKKKK